MKFTFIALVSSVALTQFVSAQVSSCGAQQVLDTCLEREKLYFKYCSPPESDYACLCKVNTALLTCYNNCPQDLGKANVQGLKDTYCSIAQTYNTTTSASASPLPSAVATNVPSNSVVAPLPSSNVTTPNNSTSAAMSYHDVGQGVVTILVAGITSWYLA